MSLKDGVRRNVENEMVKRVPQAAEGLWATAARPRAKESAVCSIWEFQRGTGTGHENLLGMGVGVRWGWGWK